MNYSELKIQGKLVPCPLSKGVLMNVDSCISECQYYREIIKNKAGVHQVNCCPPQEKLINIYEFGELTRGDK